MVQAKWRKIVYEAEHSPIGARAEIELKAELEGNRVTRVHWSATPWVHLPHAACTAAKSMRHVWPTGRHGGRGRHGGAARLPQGVPYTLNRQDDTSLEQQLGVPSIT